MLRWLRRLWRRGSSDEERVADAVMGVEEDEVLLMPGVFVREEPGIPRVIPSTPSAAIIGAPEKGPVAEPVLIGPSFRKPRLWEFWRWHRYPRWRRESRGALRKFEETFGIPAGGRP